MQLMLKKGILRSTAYISLKLWLSKTQEDRWDGELLHFQCKYIPKKKKSNNLLGGSKLKKVHPGAKKKKNNSNESLCRTNKTVQHVLFYRSIVGITGNQASKMAKAAAENVFSFTKLTWSLQDIQKNLCQTSLGRWRAFCGYNNVKEIRKRNYSHYRWTKAC